MKRTCALLCVMVAACVDGSDDTQVIENASTPPGAYEANSLLQMLAIDAASCVEGSKRTEPGFEVYESEDTFRAAYEAARPRATSTPDIDFTRYVVVASYVAQQSCPAAVTVGAATVLSDRVNVDVSATPAPACTNGATGPSFAFVRLDRVDLPYFATGPAPFACP